MAKLGFFDEAGEQLLETGQSVASQMKKQVVQGIGTTAGRQINPGSTDAQKKDEPDNTGQEYFKHLLGDTKTMTPQEIAAAEHSDKTKAEAKMAEIKQHIRRYRDQERELEEYRMKKSKEMPKYISGTPGQERTAREQQKKIEESKKLEEEKKKKQDLPESAAVLQGSREKSRFTVG